MSGPQSLHIYVLVPIEFAIPIISASAIPDLILPCAKISHCGSEAPTRNSETYVDRISGPIVGTVFWKI